MVATVECAVFFETVPNDTGAAVFTLRCQSMDRAFEPMGLIGHRA